MSEQVIPVIEETPKSHVKEINKTYSNQPRNIQNPNYYPPINANSENSLAEKFRSETTPTANLKKSGLWNVFDCWYEFVNIKYM